MKKFRGIFIVALIFSVSFFNFSFALEVKDFYTIQPSYTYSSWQEEGDKFIPLPENIPNQAEIIPAAVRIVLEKFPDFTYSTMLKDEEVTPELIKNIGQNQIVIWQGHGNWHEDTKTISLETAEPFDYDRYEIDLEYRDDVDNGRILNDGYYAEITSKYIDKYGGNMTGSLIYLGTCESGHDGDDTLAKSFLDKGAAAVIVNTQTIQMMYGNIMQYTTIKLMSEINPQTEDYYTVSEALSTAKTIYGKNDLEKGYYPAALGAEPIIFGDTNYRLATTHAEPEVEPEKPEDSTEQPEELTIPIPTVPNTGGY